MDRRFKYQIETRIEAARLFDAGFGFQVVSTRLGLPRDTARFWHDSHWNGLLLGLGVMSTHKQYSAEEKLAAVEMFLDGFEKTAVMARFGIGTRALITKWVAIYRAEGPEGLQPKAKGRPKKNTDSSNMTDAQRIYRLEVEVEVLKKIQRSFGGRRLSAEGKAQIITSLEHKYLVGQLCQFLGLSRSTFYYHRAKLTRPDAYEAVGPLLRQVFDNSYKAYGYRRIQAVLKQKHGFSLSGKTVLKLMREENRVCLIRRKKYVSYRGAVGLAAPNVLERDFSTTAPNRKWATDVTKFKVLGQKHYFSPVIDLFNGEVITYTLKTAPDLNLVTSMLSKAIEKLPAGSKTIIHSDQGWHYRHLAYQHQLQKAGIRQSMSRKGNCLDNAVAENFFGHFKEEFLRQQTFTSLDQFRNEMDRYIHWFNNDRIRLKLKGLSPVEYRTQSLAKIPFDSELNVQ